MVIVLPTRIPTTKPAASGPAIISATTEQLLRLRDALPLDDVGRVALRARVIEENLPMTRRLARRYAGRGEIFDDLAQVAALALVKAVDGYDPERDTLFINYAIPSIVGALKRHFRDTAWGMRVPRAMQELVLLVRDTTDALTQQLGKMPTSVELADHLDVTLDHLLAAQAAAHAYRPGSLEDSLSRVDGAPSANLARALSHTDRRYATVDNQLTVRAMVAVLPVRDREILTMRYYQEMTQSEISAVVGVSQMQVSRLLHQSLTRLRAATAAPAQRTTPAAEFETTRR